MKNQPFILPMTGLMIGIVFTELFQFIGFTNTTKWVVLLFFFLLILLFGLKRYFSPFIFMFFVCFGWIYSSQYNHHHPLPETVLNQESILKLRVKETYRSSEKYRKYKVEIQRIDSLNYTNNYSLLYLKKETPELAADEVVWIRSKIQHPQKALNPHQFDYSKFLKRRKIHSAIFAESVLFTEETKTSIAHFCSKLKRNIYNQLLENGYSKQVADQVGAMLLGDRTEMDAEVEDSYRKTGVVHILAISGLHVMMVYSIFYILLFPLSYLKHGKTFRIFLSLLLIWSFVVLVGFHPPVLRSAIMIAIYHTTVAFQRKPNIYHTLTVAAFTLLFINPNYLFEPGFQLSFSAVFFIVFFHEAFQKYIHTRSTFKKHVYNFVGTCVSAQAGTLPFSVYYFNQTSGLFLAGNLVMIAASYLMVAGGMLTIFLNLTGLNFDLWTQFFNFFISSCNNYIAWLASFESFVFDAVKLNLLEGFLILVGMIVLRFTLIQPKAKYVLSLLTLIFVFQVERMYQNKKLEQKHELIVFHHYKNSVIGIRNGNQMDVFMEELDDSIKLKKYTLRPYSIQQNIKKIRLRSINDLKREEHLISNSEYILLQNNFKLDSLFTTSQIVLDGSSYPNHRNNFEELNIWDTKTDGALVVSLPKQKKIRD